MQRIARFLVFMFLTWFAKAQGQTSLNPDISVIPDFRTYTTTQKGNPDKNKVNFTMEEIEMAIQAPLNPYSRADVFVSFTNDESEPVDVEEAYFTIEKGLPWNFNIKGGKFLVDFSKLNTTHSHIFPFVERPLYQQYYFGEEGLKDVGVELNTLLPTGDIYTRISGTAATGDELDGGRKSLLYTGRLSSFFQLTELSALETGVGTATGIRDTLAKRFNWYNVDAKFKWKKDRYTSLTLWAEALISRYSGLNTFGGYVAANYQFKRRFEIGSKLDLTQSIDSKEKTRSISGNFNFLPVEETLVFRLLVTRTKAERERAYNTYMLQALFSLGPHKAHIF